MPATIAILGLGSIGRRHAANFAALGATVIGFDPVGAARDAASGAALVIARSRNTALASANAAIICSPSGAHLDDLDAILNAGCNALVEKPLGHQRERATALVERGEREGRLIAVGYNLRFHPCVAQARNALAAGDIGDPIWLRALAASHLPDWRAGQDHRTGYAADPKAGGVIMDYTHEIDLAIYLFGPAQLGAASAAATGRLGLTTDDIADLVMLHHNGARTNIHIDYLTRPAQRIVEIAGTDGFIRADLIARRFQFWSPDGTLRMDETHPGSFGDDYIREAQHFLDCLKGATPVCSARDGLASLEIALDARQAAGLPT
jgi:predicted dehydrogenase